MEGKLKELDAARHRRSLVDSRPDFERTGATRKIVLFWLVHPDHRIISTADVAPQQGVVPREEALRRRAALMEERSLAQKEVTEIFERTIEREYNFCEH